MTDNIKYQGLLGNPLLMAGMGLLTSGGTGRGMMSGLNIASQYQNNDLNRKLTELKMREIQSRMNQPDASAPIVREFIEGDKKVVKQWNALEGKWITLSEGPRWNPNAGMQLNVDSDGGVQFAQGRPLPLTNANRNKVQDKQINAMEHLARLKTIEESFKPTFQKFTTRANAAWTSAKEKAGFKPTPQEQQELADLSTFKAYAISNLNTAIKEASGATVTEQEETRLNAGMPNPGLGIFDGDSPTEFQAKLEATISELKKAAARSQYAQTHGLEWQSIPLTNVEGLMDKRGNELEQQYRRQGMSQQEAESRAMQQVREEFGL